MVLGPTFISHAVTSGPSTGICSLAGAQSISDLVPPIYYTVVAICGLGMIGAGGFSAAKSVRG
ncbi:MAG: hypothetical protein IIC23_00340 [Chloroflexi bacterium]|nr:hypothetical protein [Chloroflexota bacterium]